MPDTPSDLPFVRTAWVLSEGIAGMENQCLGLAEALGLTPIVKRIGLRAPWRWLPPQIFPLPFWALTRASDRLQAPWPDLLIACGRKSVPFAVAIKRLSGGRTYTVQMQDPKISPQFFDFVIPPAHDHLTGRNVFAITGAPHRITPAKLASARQSYSHRFANLPRPLVGVLVGGPNRSFEMTPEDIDGLSQNLRKLGNEEGAGLAITLSRRTPDFVEARLRKALEGLAYDVSKPGSDNPYLGILALSDAFVVTADSVNMATEAAITGKPIFIAELKGGAPKFDRFHAALTTRGIARVFDGKLAHWSYPPLNETSRAADEIRRRLTLKLYSRGHR